MLFRLSLSSAENIKICPTFQRGKQDFIKAEETFNKAIVIIENSEGKNASELKHILLDYKNFYEKQNKKEEAKNIERRIRSLKK